MTRKQIWIGLLSAASLIIAVGSFVAATEALGLDHYLPVTRGELIQEIGTDLKEQKLYWAEQYRQQLRQNEFERQKWERENPREPVPHVFDQQRSILEQRIQKLEKEALE